MAHCYGDQGTFRRWLSGGDASRDPEQLTALEGASRAVDAFCQRGSGFGPVHETRTFTCAGRRLLLGGDLAAFTTLEVNGEEVVDPPEITGGYTRVLTGYHGDVSITGPWTYPYTTVAAGALESALDDSAETVTFVSASAYSAGQTLLIDDEQLYVIATDSTTLTVERGAHGTTAASHLDEAPIRTYRYDRSVVNATYLVAQRRWKQRDAGVNGLFGAQQQAGGMPMSSNLDTEWSILLANVSHLRFAQMYRGGGR